MKQVTNASFQSLTVFFRTPTGVKSYWMQPGETKVIPESYVSQHIKKLVKRRQLSVANYIG